MEIKKGTIIIAIAVLIAIFQIGMYVLSEYRYENEILYSWNLADKASTLEQKSHHIDNFISNLEKQEFSEYDAIILKTPDNNIKNNIDVVKSLRIRLDEIKDLDPESFAYQTAIQQITAQEQGEANKMMTTIQSGWVLKHYPIVWSWIAGIFAIFWTLLLILGIGIRSAE